MAQDLTVPDPTIVLDLLEAFRRSKVMFAAVNLGIFDELMADTKPAIELASTLRCDPDGLERLLDACVGLQLLSKTADRYAITPVAKTYLTASSPLRVTGYVGYSNSVMWKLWACLEDAVREGSHRWQQAFGWDGPIFSHFFKTEEAKREFLMGMHGYGVISSPHVVSAFDLTRYAHLVDLGGATGHLAIAACQRYPQMIATVYDLPGAIPLAREIVGCSDVDGRIQFAEGDFFNDAIPPSDVIAVGRILHDWSEDKVRLLLDRIASALRPGGAILIAEKVLLDDKTGPRWAQLQSLNMLSCTEGKERSLPEYETLLIEAGFTNVQCKRLPAPLDAVLAVKS